MLVSNQYERFWGLRDNWWKQVIDGEFQTFGEKVFDEGLHGGKIEPGFLSSAKLASEYVSQHLNERVDINFYKTINRIACTHFAEVERKEVNMDATEIGTFRTQNKDTFKSLKCSGTIYDVYNEECSFPKEGHSRPIMNLSEKILNLPFVLKMGEFVGLYNFDVINIEDVGVKLRLTGQLIELLSSEFQENNIEKIEDRSQACGYKYHSKIKFCQQILNYSYDGDSCIPEIRQIVDCIFNEEGNFCIKNAEKSIEGIKNELKEIQKYSNLPKTLAYISEYTSKGKYRNFLEEITVNYEFINQEEIEAAVKIFFDQYYSSLDQTNQPTENNLKAIASLFQKLEWLHPFFDGQGRTDLILLSKFLVEQGFSPAILYKPYYSTFHSLKEWMCYLQEGISTWELERSKMKI